LTFSVAGRRRATRVVPSALSIGRRRRVGPWRSLVSASDWGLVRPKRCADLRKRRQSGSDRALVRRCGPGHGQARHLVRGTHRVRARRIAPVGRVRCPRSPRGRPELIRHESAVLTVDPLKRATLEVRTMDSRAEEPRLGSRGLKSKFIDPYDWFAPRGRESLRCSVPQDPAGGSSRWNTRTRSPRRAGRRTTTCHLSNRHISRLTGRITGA
jgi:hypothetical protein